MVDVSDSEDEPEQVVDQESFQEVDSNVYIWSPVKLTSLSRSKRDLVKKMMSQSYVEYDESSSPPVVQSVWKVDGLSRRPECDSLYVRYWDASLPRPRDSDSFEYTLLSQFRSWAKPECDIDGRESTRSEGVFSDEIVSHSEGTSIEEDITRSEGAITAHSSNSEGDHGTSFNVVSPRRRSSRLIGSSLHVPIKAAVLQFKRLLHTMHRDLPIRLTKKNKDGSIVLVSRAEDIKKIEQTITPASMKQALAGPDVAKWKTAKDEAFGGHSVTVLCGLQC